jgi:hypothetical protein
MRRQITQKKSVSSQRWMLGLWQVGAVWVSPTDAPSLPGRVRLKPRKRIAAPKDRIPPKAV